MDYGMDSLSVEAQRFEKHLRAAQKKFREAGGNMGLLTIGNDVVAQEGVDCGDFVDLMLQAEGQGFIDINQIEDKTHQDLSGCPDIRVGSAIHVARQIRSHAPRVS